MAPHYKQDRYSSEQEGSISLGDQTLFNAAEATLTVVKDAVLTGCPGDWGGGCSPPCCSVLEQDNRLPPQLSPCGWPSVTSERPETDAVVRETITFTCPCRES